MKIKRRRKGHLSILDLTGPLQGQELVILERGFKHIPAEETVVLNLGDVTRIRPEALKSFIRELQRRNRAGGSLKFLKVPGPILELLRKTQLDRRFEIYEYEDELGYIDVESTDRQKPKVNLAGLNAKTKDERCPNCGAILRTGAHSCFECGTTVRRRRATRHQVALPLLYNMVLSDEFLDGKWIGGITDDIDLVRFSGVGLYTTDSFQPQQELRLVFPTISMGDAEAGSLTIFCGRVKNLVEVEGYTRVGLALFDTIEYRAQWVKE